jgi:hypothetical protein
MRSLQPPAAEQPAAPASAPERDIAAADIAPLGVARRATRLSELSSPGGVLGLQQTLGNQGTARLLHRSLRAHAPGGALVQRDPGGETCGDPGEGGEAWSRDAEGRLTDEEVARLRSRVVEATREGAHGERGVMIDEGSYERVRAWCDTRINRALDLLANLDHGTDAARGGRRTRGRRGAMDRLVLAWHNRLDDLGPPDRSTPEDRAGEYQNILEFVDRLDRLSLTTLGSEYLSTSGPGGMSRMPSIRLAGATPAVHPRALWFTAAAQAGMDARAGRDSGRGHYIPAGGFHTLLRDIASMAERLGAEPTPRTGQRRGSPPRSDPSAPLANGGRIYSALRGELLLALQVLEDQASGSDSVAGYRHDEHREPVLRDFLIARAEQIRALPETASDEEAGLAARQLAAALAGLPGGSSRRHGFGSVDPHGTEHAMGLAIDIYNGAGPGGSRTNFAPPEEYWPFIQLLIERHGAAVGLAPHMRPDSWSDLDSTGDQATAARGIAALVRTQGASLATEIEAQVAPDPAQARADARVATRLTNLRRRAARALGNRLHALSQAAGRSDLDWRLANDVVRERDALAADLAAIDSLSHQKLVLKLQAHFQALAALKAHEDADGEVGPPPPTPAGRRRRGDPLAAVGPDDARSARLDLSRLILELEGLGPEAEASVTRHNMQSMAGLVRTRGFRNWLAAASNPDRPLYDQPTTMVEAFNDVVGTSFYGGHHWEVASLPEHEGGDSILDRIGNYRAALRADLQGVAEGPRARPPRGAAEVERILSILAESPGGRRALFGTLELVEATASPASAPGAAPAEGSASQASAPGAAAEGVAGTSRGAVPPGADAILHEVLAEHLGDLTPMLQRIHAQVVAPYEGTSSESTNLLRELRDRGFYLAPTSAAGE